MPESKTMPRLVPEQAELRAAVALLEDAGAVAAPLGRAAPA